MADIDETEADGVVTFTEATPRGKAWLIQPYHESTVRFDVTNEMERRGAERLQSKARSDGILIAGLNSI